MAGALCAAAPSGTNKPTAAPKKLRLSDKRLMDNTNKKGQRLIAGLYFEP
jgi:hypothetical protein